MIGVELSVSVACSRLCVMYWSCWRASCFRRNSLLAGSGWRSINGDVLGIRKRGSLSASQACFRVPFTRSWIERPGSPARKASTNVREFPGLSRRLPKCARSDPSFSQASSIGANGPNGVLTGEVDPFGASSSTRVVENSNAIGIDENPFDRCKFCGDERYKDRYAAKGKMKVVARKKFHYLLFISRLKRFYAWPTSASNMRWHYENRQWPENVTCHPSNGRSLRHFDKPLFHELKELWQIGVTTYDTSMRQNFNIKAALMWTMISPLMLLPIAFSDLSDHIWEPLAELTDIRTLGTRVPCNDDGGASSTSPQIYGVFNQPGYHSGTSDKRNLNDAEFQAVRLMVLLNCPEVKPYLE
ncbi:hypothetical protein CRG98_009527 [Punica granatum]|uniref:Uncharacterized protein n=1 Tax=Punica granatum TaxID=22663 RepID=A0A2I0KNK1_PUNGR|nr:hypothetical protein CRG98_009527 [Punica granatum]